MKYQINFDDIKAEMETIAETMLTKYEISPNEVAQDGIEVVLPRGVCPVDVIDDLEGFSWLAEDLGYMFGKLNNELYSILCAARDEVDKTNGS